MIRPVILLSIALSSGPLFAEPTASLAAPDGNFVMVAAHRGGYVTDRKDRAPENSLTNLELAIEKGFDVYETDIRCTKDGAFVIVHDPTLDRETGGTGPVEAFSFEEVKTLRKRYRDGSLSESPVASLEELLLAGRGRILFKPDLKPGVINRFPELAQLIARLEMLDQVFIRTGRKDAPTIARHFNEGVPRVEIMFKVDTAEQVRQVADRFSPATIQVNVEKEESITPAKRKAIHTAVELGILVETHSYRDDAQTTALVEAGVRMFHTAMPDETLDWLRENDWRSR